MNPQEVNKMEKEIMEKYNLTNEEFLEAASGPRPSIVWPKDTQVSALERMETMLSMLASQYAEMKKKKLLYNKS